MRVKKYWPFNGVIENMTYRQVNNINVFAPSQAVFSPTFTEEGIVAVEVGGN